MFYLIHLIKTLKTKVIRRRPVGYNLDHEDIEKLLWICEYKNETHPSFNIAYKDLTASYVNEIIGPVINHVNNRFDCSDFRLLSLVKFKLEANSFLAANKDIDDKLKDCFLNFKYSIKEPGYDSMCYYSENHLLAFATLEYIVGNMYENELFTNSNVDGLTHKKLAKDRMLIWFELRKKYSYSEFYSNNYLPINLAILAMIVRYIDDEELVNLAKRELDELLFMFSSTLFAKSFVNATGRDYPRNIMNSNFSEPNSLNVVESVFGDKKKAHFLYKGTAFLFTSMLEAKNKDGKPFYEVKKEILDLENKELEIKAGFGLDLKDYKKEGLNNLNDKSLMMQLGSGALTNKEVINNTINFIKKYDLKRNDFVSWVNYLYSPLLKVLGLMPLVSKTLRYFPNGMALGKANVYTYKTKDYKLSCALNYQAFESGAQKTTSVVTLKDGITIFTNHPLRVDSSSKSVQYEGDRSPSYFGGYGISPSSVAYKNVMIINYKLPMFKRVFSKFKMLHLTHTFIPTELLEEVIVEDNKVFVGHKGAFLAIICKNKLEFNKFDKVSASSTQGRLKDETKPFDLVSKGKDTYYIYELSSDDKESFDEFINRIKNNKVEYKNKKITYYSNSIYEAKYNKYLKVDGKDINLDYNKIDINQFIKENN